ncbi:MAG: PEGA domain-containing protein [Archangium gephyra]|uniref:PEGA domain-containing protein n=1 Tax=Archangium gephyra TaxID=48 RepID=A0A2W5T8T0_9BACT|nr:MAG: PEGA domain-containing protein [Archangium gephyra]
MKRALLLSIIAVQAFAAPPPSDKRVAALILPMDKSAEALMLKVESFANEALNEYDGFKVRSSDDMFGVAVDEEAAASLKRAELGFKESKASFDERNYEDAERKLRATIKEYSKAVAAMKTCGNLCETVAMYAAVLQARGDVEEAKIAILDLIALAPTYELDRKRYPQNFLALKAQVATSRNAQLRGGIVVKTRPSGARVFINGELQGYSPVTVSTLPIGKHLVRIERPGFKQLGSMVEITPEDQEITQELTATSGYKAYDGLMDRLAGEALKDKGGSTMTSVANSLKLDRAVIGVLRDLESGTTELTMSYYDLKSGKRIAMKRASFQGDEFGQLRGEVGRMVNHLVNAADQESSGIKSSDPLENKGGMEDWSGDDRGGKNSKRDKKSSGGDPLDRTSGTEDW